MPVSVRGCSVSVVHILHSDVECHKPLLGWGEHLENCSRGEGEGEEGEGVGLNSIGCNTVHVGSALSMDFVRCNLWVLLLQS